MLNLVLDAIGKCNQNNPYPPSSTWQRAEIHSKKDVHAKPKNYFSSVFNSFAGAFAYMNIRARVMNSRYEMNDSTLNLFVAHARDYCSKPHMMIILFSLPLLYVISPTAVVVVPLLIGIGAAALVIQSFLPIYIGLDFSLMGAVLGSILFGPLVGVGIVVATYVLALQFPAGIKDAFEFERIFMFSFLALIVPYIPVNDIMLKAIVATYIGEFMEMLWHKIGEDYPWPIAFLKVFPRSLLYVYIFHQVLVFFV